MSYVSNWLPTNRTKRSARSVIALIMRDAFLANYNVKQIAGYFGVDIQQVYRSISVKALKAKMKERLEIEKTIG